MAKKNSSKAAKDKNPRINKTDISKKKPSKKNVASTGSSQPKKDSLQTKQVELLKDVVVSIAGQDSDKIVDLLYGKKNVNEFLIAKKLDITINQARNILYKLAEEGLVSFSRKKDKKSGGWYTYFWTLNSDKSLSVLKRKLEHEIEHAESQLGSRQTRRFYYCPNCDLEMNEENALLNDFTCPECGEVLHLKDNAQDVSDLEGALTKFKEKLHLVNEEIAVIESKHEASKARKLKLEEKKKKEERDAKRKARQREKKKLMEEDEKKSKRKSSNKKTKKTEPPASKNSKKKVKKKPKVTAKNKAPKKRLAIKKTKRKK